MQRSGGGARHGARQASWREAVWRHLAGHLDPLSLELTGDRTSLGVGGSSNGGASPFPELFNARRDQIPAASPFPELVNAWQGEPRLYKHCSGAPLPRAPLPAHSYLLRHGHPLIRRRGDGSTFTAPPWCEFSVKEPSDGGSGMEVRSGGTAAASGRARTALTCGLKNGLTGGL